IAGCSTSTWEYHRHELADAEARGDDAREAKELHWQIDNAFQHALPEERTPQKEAARYLRLAELAAKHNKPRVAVADLRDALTADPHQSAAGQAQLDHLPGSVAERPRLKREVPGDNRALAPEADEHVGEEREPDTQ